MTETVLYRDIGELHPVALCSAAQYDKQERRLLETTAGRSMEYNHKKERVSVMGAGQNRQYLYDEASHLIGEYGTDGKAIVEYVWLGDKPVAAIQANGSILYLVTDRLNTPRRGYDSVNFYQLWRWEPDAFGVSGASVSGGVVMNLRFAGQVYDVPTGLHYNLNRFYNPLLGRYLEADPIGLEGGNNPYAYAGNDPVNNVDPSGLMEVNLDFSGMLNSALNNVGAYSSIPINIPVPQLPSFPTGASLMDGAATLASRAAPLLTMLTLTGDTPRNQNITVYRGTSRYAETVAWNQTGLMMSDATRNAFLESGNIKSSMTIGVKQHVNLTVQYGSEFNLARAQSSMGTEFPNVRSMFSVTTNYRVANSFAGPSGSVYSANLDRRLLLPSPLNKTTGGESEYFIRVAYPMVRVK